MKFNPYLINQRWSAYLFERHSQNEIEVWAKKLKYFRYFRALGGHANDCDSFDLAINFINQEELQLILQKLNIKYLIHKLMPPQPLPGISYSGDEFNKFINIIPESNYIEQPGKVLINNCQVIVWCTKSHLKISVGHEDESWDVIEDDVSKCIIIEDLISTCDFNLQDPPYDSKNYICPKYYPEFFVTRAQQGHAPESASRV